MSEIEHEFERAYNDMLEADKTSLEAHFKMWSLIDNGDDDELIEAVHRYRETCSIYKMAREYYQDMKDELECKLDIAVTVAFCETED